MSQRGMERESARRASLTEAATVLIVVGLALVGSLVAAAIFVVLNRPTAWLVALALAGALVALPGCSSTTLAQEEAAAHSALVGLEDSVRWLQANPEIVSAALDQAAKAAPDHPVVQRSVAQARAAIAAGDLATAWSVIHAGNLLTAPVAPPR